MIYVYLTNTSLCISPLRPSSTILQGYLCLISCWVNWRQIKMRVPEIQWTSSPHVNLTSRESHLHTFCIYRHTRTCLCQYRECLAYVYAFWIRETCSHSYMCIYIHRHEPILTPSDAYIWPWTEYIWVYIQYVCTCVCACVCKNVWMCVWVWVYTCIRVYVYTYNHIQDFPNRHVTYTHTQTHTHTHVYVQQVFAFLCVNYSCLKSSFFEKQHLNPMKWGFVLLHTSFFHSHTCLLSLSCPHPTSHFLSPPLSPIPSLSLFHKTANGSQQREEYFRLNPQDKTIE